jgi:hypothetical protein
MVQARYGPDAEEDLRQGRGTCVGQAKAVACTGGNRMTYERMADNFESRLAKQQTDRVGIFFVDWPNRKRNLKISRVLAAIILEQCALFRQRP